MYKYSFLLPYFNRKEQFINTIESFLSFYNKRKDFELVIIEDYKNYINCHDELMEIIDKYSCCIPITHIIRPEEFIYNASAHYNTAAQSASGNYFVLSNPECLHTTNILMNFDNILNDAPNTYIICGCVNHNGEWYQHSVNNNKMYHWCSCIPSSTYFKIGGFDEEYTYGFSYDDDDFISNILKHKIPICLSDESLVLHQAHPQIKWSVPNFQEGLVKNRNYFMTKWNRYIDL